MRTIGLMFFLFLASMRVCGSATSSSPRGDKWFDMRLYYLVAFPAMSPKGNTVDEMIREARKQGYDVVYGMNANFFGREGGKLFCIGQFCIGGVNYSDCPAPVNRGRISQTEDGIVIDFSKPADASFTIEVGPVLLQKGELVRNYQGFSNAFWNQITWRSVVAVKGNCVHLMRFNASLWQVSKWLKSQHYEAASNLDGGSSCYKTTRVKNAILVCKKPGWRDGFKTPSLKTTSALSATWPPNLMPQYQHYPDWTKSLPSRDFLP